MSPRLEREAADPLDRVRARLANPSPKGRPVGFEEIFEVATLQPSSDCIEFTGHRNRDGYGMVRFCDKQFLTHRVAYCCANDLRWSEIAGLVVRHRCDNPPCINPAHLVAGTQADNVRDMHTRGRYVGAPRGEASVRAKLTNDQVASIRAAYGRRGVGGLSQKRLAAKFGVSSDCIHKIVNNRARRQG